MISTRWVFSAAIALLGCVFAVGCGPGDPLPQSQTAVKLDKSLDWSGIRLLAVQEGNRYKTIESFAREKMSAMTGREHLPGLSPSASLMEWLFNRDAYDNVPLVKVKDAGLRYQFAASFDPVTREALVQSGLITPAQLRDRSVQQRMEELEVRSATMKAVNRVRGAEAVATYIDQIVRVVPQPGTPKDAPWFAPRKLEVNAAIAFAVRNQDPKKPLSLEEILARFGPPVAGFTATQSVDVVTWWTTLGQAWRSGDVKQAQDALNILSEQLPKLAAAGFYPTLSQRSAEARYYALDKFIWGYGIYFAGAIVGVWTMITRWRAPWMIAMAMMLIAVVIHTYGVALRWYILDRIPIGNAVEAMIAASCAAVMLVAILEIVFRNGVFVFAGNMVGFLALVVAGFVMPDRPELTAMKGILDDVMLRIHTVCIIFSYLLIAIGAMIATVYLFGYYFRGVTPRVAVPAGAGMPMASFVGSGGGALQSRPVLAGALPGDEKSTLPKWLNDVDWCHLIILNIVFVLLFAGTILGAVWADYSWGRPWGWDPKEVFAMNTWLIYAIMIHVRFVVKNRGLCTACLSIIGFLMMCFNWYAVNYVIVGLHSYA